MRRRNDGWKHTFDIHGRVKLNPAKIIVIIWKREKTPSEEINYISTRVTEWRRTCLASRKQQRDLQIIVYDMSFSYGFSLAIWRSKIRPKTTGQQNQSERTSNIEGHEEKITFKKYRKPTTKKNVSSDKRKICWKPAFGVSGANKCPSMNAGFQMWILFVSK